MLEGVYGCFMICNEFLAGNSEVSLELQCFTAELIIGAKPNPYCEAIELVYGGSPKICVLVERKSRLRVK